MTRKARLHRVESAARQFKGDPDRWLRMQPDAVLNVLIARDLAGKTIAGVTFPDDPDAHDPREIDAMLTDEVLDEVLLAVTNGLEEANRLEKRSVELPLRLKQRDDECRHRGAASRVT